MSIFNKFIKDVTLLYNQSGSCRQVAKQLGISAQKVKKILVNVGAYEDDTYKQINVLRKQGLSAKEIARTLGISISYVHSYLPYTKGVYNLPVPSQNAKKLREWRKNK